MTGSLHVITSLRMEGLTEGTRGDEVLAVDRMGLACKMTHALTLVRSALASTVCPQASTNH
jgi:hypothetical protein